LPVYYYFININYIVNYYYTRVLKKWVLFFYLKGSEERLKVEKIVKSKQPEIYKQLKQERKENLSFNFYKRLMENNKGVDERKCR
jgi:hypothetical protein